MLEEDRNNVVFFPKESTYQIGKITYIVTSHYDENSEPLVAKIKNLLKADIQKELVNAGVTGIDVV